MAAPEPKKGHHRRAGAGARRRLCAREEGARDHRNLRSGACRPPLSGRRLGRRQQADVHASRRHGHPGIGPGRCGEPDGQADEDPRRAARRVAPEERGRDRGAAREGHRQVREARRDHRLHRADDEPGPHARRQRDLRDQGARRRDLLAAPALEEDVVRDGAPHARSARARRRAGRHPAMPDARQHSDVAGADGACGPDRRDRRPADGARRLQLGYAGVRRGRRQLDDDHRRDGEHRGSRAQHPALEDLRFRLRLLRRRQPDHRGVDLRQAPGAAAEGRRPPRHARAEGDAAQGDVGRRAPPHRRDGRDRAAAAREDRRLRDPGRPQVHHRPRRRHRQGARITPARSSRRCSPSTSTRASTRRST